MGRALACRPMSVLKAVGYTFYGRRSAVGLYRNGRLERSFVVSGQTPVGPRGAAFRGSMLIGPLAFSWRLTAVGHDEPVGSLHVALAAARA